MSPAFAGVSIVKALRVRVYVAIGIVGSLKSWALESLQIDILD